MKLYDHACDYAIYTLKIVMKNIMRINVYLDISLFVHFKQKEICNNCAYTITIIKKFNDKSFEMHFLREQFWRALMFWNAFFEGAILKSTYVLKCIFWGRDFFRIYGCCFTLLWLLNSVVADIYFLPKFSPQVKLLKYWHV